MGKLTYEDLKEGARVSYSFNEKAEGIVHMEGHNQWYFLSNHPNYNGSLCADLKGYKYSFWFGNDKALDEQIIDMEMIGAYSTTDDDVRGDSVPRNKKIDTLLILGL